MTVIGGSILHLGDPSPSSEWAMTQAWPCRARHGLPDVRGLPTPSEARDDVGHFRAVTAQRVNVTRCGKKTTSAPFASASRAVMHDAPRARRRVGSRVVQPFVGKTVVVTGGASGIGRGLAERLCARGATCVIADLDERAVRDAAGAIGCSGVALDVRDAARVRRVLEEVAREHGPIELLINCAGVARAGETHLFEYDDWKLVLDVNVYGVVNCIHAVYPEMVRRRSGHILNIASIAGLFPSSGQVSYVTSKYAVVGLSHALRAEAATHGVKVSVACPGIIDTPMRRGYQVRSGNPERVLKLIPRGIDVGTCCDIILAGVDRNEATILVGGLAKALSSLQRLSPWVTGKLNELSIRLLTRP